MYKVPAESRCRWHHDQVLKAVSESTSNTITAGKHHLGQKTRIAFVKAGEETCQQQRTRSGLLDTASDCQLQADLRKQLKFPQHITETSLCPDRIIVSEATKQLIVLKLTMSWEEHMEESNERKCAKYQELVEKCWEGAGRRTMSQYRWAAEPLHDAHSAKS